MNFDVIIVGSGASGVAAALGMSKKGIIPLMLDVGHEAPDINPLESNFYDFRKSNDSFDIMIGKNYEGLKHVVDKKTPSPKVSSPYMDFVTKDVEKLAPLEQKGLPVLQSFSMGGLANAWGAGLYRCIGNDLINLPITAADLSPYYDQLTEEIGICGADDDLTQFFGSAENLLKPLGLSKKAEKLYSSYKKGKKKFNQNGIYLGRPRIGFLTEDYDNRSSFRHHNLEMWFPNLPYVYTPTHTLKKLIKANKVVYRRPYLVKCWTRKDNSIIVHAQDIRDGSIVQFKCKRLLLAGGTVNTTKIVLRSKEDCKTKLPLLDKSLIQVPLIYPSFVGTRFDIEAFGSTNLNVVFDFKEFNLRLQGSIIELTAPARSVFYEMLPLSARDNLTFIRLFLPSLLIVFLWFPSDKDHAGYISLRADDKLEVCTPPGIADKRAIRRIAGSFRSLGIFTHSSFVKPPNHALQYAGTLPMTIKPCKEYQCSRDGELFGEKGIHIVDGSLFSYMPSRNFGMTLMANAMRIADRIADNMKSQ